MLLIRRSLALPDDCTLFPLLSFFLSPSLPSCVTFSLTAALEMAHWLHTVVEMWLIQAIELIYDIFICCSNNFTSTILRYFHFTWLFPFHPTLYYHSTTIQGETLYFYLTGDISDVVPPQSDPPLNLSDGSWTFKEVKLSNISLRKKTFEIISKN